MKLFAYCGLVISVLWLNSATAQERTVTIGGNSSSLYFGPVQHFDINSQPITSFFQSFLRTRRELEPPAGLFPTGARLATDTPDPAREAIYEPMFRWTGARLATLRLLQHGNVHLYVLYIAVTVIALLAWKLA